MFLNRVVIYIIPICVIGCTPDTDSALKRAETNYAIQSCIYGYISALRAVYPSKNLNNYVNVAKVECTKVVNDIERGN